MAILWSSQVAIGAAGRRPAGSAGGWIFIPSGNSVTDAPSLPSSLATAVILQYIVGGTVWVESHLRIHPLYWIAIGLLCAATAGASAWLTGQAFLTSLAWHGELPLLGEIHLSSVLLFDIGVYMLVVGATVLMLVAIAHQSLRNHHRKTAPGGKP